MGRAAGALALSLLLLAAPAAAQDDLGATVYAKYCAQCHNDNGDGRGIAAPYLEPPPRDLTSGKYKLRSTPTGTVPTDADLERSIRNGLPGTAMPAFPDLTSAELDAVIEHVKAFSPAFEDPEAQGEPIPIPSSPPYSEELAARGKEIFQANCITCHGQLGRGDGGTAPLQRDQWHGDSIRVADMWKPWTFRAGPTREDIYRVLITGLDGTPMASYLGALEDADVWAIATWIVSLSGNDPEAPYTNLLRAVGADGDLDLERGRELFEGAPESMFPVVGQIMEPGRQFYPGAIAVSARAVYTDDEIAVLLTWHDMRAETTGTNAPDLPAPLWEEEHDVTPGAGEGAPPAADDPFADFAAGPAATGQGAADPFGDLVAEEPAAEPSAADVWGEAAVAETREPPGVGGFWDEETAPASGPTGPTAEFSDAVAIQLPVNPPEPGQVVKPYFLLGDASNPVELWFVDLAEPDAARSYVARGSAAIAAGETDPPEVVASYEQGEWAVIFKARRRRGGRFAEEQFLPIAFSVWDGFHRERGNKRGLTQWQYLYLEPRERPSPWGPMLRAGLGVLGLELLVIAWARRRRRAAELPAREPASEPVGPAGAEPARRPA
jgi:DMSO reductase family type II enzyme heme b subunit